MAGLVDVFVGVAMGGAFAVVPGCVWVKKFGWLAGCLVD